MTGWVLPITYNHLLKKYELWHIKCTHYFNVPECTKHMGLLKFPIGPYRPHPLISLVLRTSSLQQNSNLRAEYFLSNCFVARNIAVCHKILEYELLLTAIEQLRSCAWFNNISVCYRLWQDFGSANLLWLNSI